MKRIIILTAVLMALTACSVNQLRHGNNGVGNTKAKTNNGKAYGLKK